MNQVEQVEQVATELREISVACIDASPERNPRVIDESEPSFVELTESVRARGVRQPVFVRPLVAGAMKAAFERALAGQPEAELFELLAGWRRVAAARAAGRTTVPAIVHHGLDDAAAFELTFIENFAREDLKPIEAMRAVAMLLARHGGDAQAVADKLGRPVSWVRRHGALDRLSADWRAAVTRADSPFAGWGVGHLTLLVPFAAEVQNDILAGLKRMAQGYDSADILRMTVKQLAGWLNEHWLRLLWKAPWKLVDAALEPRAGACAECPKRSSAQGELWPEEIEGDKHDRCLDAACWGRKGVAQLKQRHAELVAEHGACYVAEKQYTAGQHERLIKDFGSLVSKYQIETVGKKTAGAVPLLMVAPTGAASVMWVKPRQERDAGSAGARPRGADGKPAPLPLSERRKRLAIRRDALAVEKVSTALHTHSDAPATLLALVAAFGTRQTRMAAEEHCWRAFDELRGDEAGILRKLWGPSTGDGGVLEVMLQRLRRPYPSSPPAVHEAERVCSVLDLDWESIRAEAAAAICEPKSWKHLKADGTPKSSGGGKPKKSKGSKAKPEPEPEPEDEK